LWVPPPLTLEVDIRVRSNEASLCLRGLFEIDRELQALVGGPEESEKVTVRGPLSLLFRMSLGQRSNQWEVAAEALSLARGPSESSPEAWLETPIGGFPLPLGRKGFDPNEASRLAWDGERMGGVELLVGAVEDGDGRGLEAAKLLGQLGLNVPIATWERLRALQESGKLDCRKVRALGWLGRRGREVPSSEAVEFTTEGPPPRLYVAGKLYEGWEPDGEIHRIRVPLSGLVGVRTVDDSDDGSTFGGTLGAGVRIRLSNGMGPVLEKRPAGARCAFVALGVYEWCEHGGDLAPTGRVFDLRACDGGPVAYGDLTDFGSDEVMFLSAMPGLYRIDSRGLLTFHPAPVLASGAPTRCKYYERSH
jgi:hypothetical protein